MSYEHTQVGRVHQILLMPAIGFSIVGLVFATSSDGSQQRVGLLLMGIGGLQVLLAYCFKQLTVRDCGDHLRLSFGPLTLLWKRLPYKGLTAVEPARTDIFDGWGMHYVPGRGWVYNLWGFDCVRLWYGAKMVRVGTDDVPVLTAFLRSKVSSDHHR